MKFILARYSDSGIGANGKRVASCAVEFKRTPTRTCTKGRRHSNSVCVNPHVIHQHIGRKGRGGGGRSGILPADGHIHDDEVRSVIEGPTRSGQTADARGRKGGVGTGWVVHVV